MKKQIITAALLAAASTTGYSQVSVTTHTANEAGFMVNSYLISSEKEAILVDAQFTVSQAEALVRDIQSSGKKLKAVYITHAHPDHYFGLETIRKAFPQVPFLAHPSVIAEIQATAQGKLDYWKSVYGDEMPKGIESITPYTGETLSLENEFIHLKLFKNAESETSVAIYLPQNNALLSGDLLYSGVHLWLVENRPESWLAALEEVKALNVRYFYPGHGAPQGASLLEKNVEYIQRFVSITSQAKSAEEGIEEMKLLYPNYALPIILELSVKSRMQK